MTSFPLYDPYDQGLLDVGEGNRIHWEASGNPDGKPVVCVHGGPGGGLTSNSRKGFDPEKFHVIQFDQRGCGKSEPNVADPAVILEHNTTHHLIADLERLREHLGVEKWMLFGGSWGPTLMLAYAERHPQRVSEMVFIAAFTSTPDEVDWLYRGAGRLLPREWEDFRAGVPEADRDGDLLAAYSRLLASPDRAVQLKAARDWCAWEDAVIAHEANGRPGQYGDQPDRELITLARMCAHYYGHHAWLGETELLDNVGRLRDIPAVFIQGRLDLSVPLLAAWRLVRAWPAAELVVIDDSGHTGSPAMGEAVLNAIKRFEPA
ncbi:prolyl aminopeptidase [Amycolatopsis sp. NPDC004368]